MGVLGERDLVGVLGVVYSLPVVDLRRDNPEPRRLRSCPRRSRGAFWLYRWRWSKGKLHVAVADRPTEELRRVLAQVSEYSVDFVLAPESDVRWAIDSSYRAIGGVDKLVQAFQAVETALQRDIGTEEAEVVDDDAPVVQVVARILTQAKRDRASDVHIEPWQPCSCSIPHRRSPERGSSPHVSIGPGLMNRIKILAGMNIVERRRPQDGQLSTETVGDTIDVRVATVATIGGEKCVLRILDKNRSAFAQRFGMSAQAAHIHSSSSSDRHSA